MWKSDPVASGSILRKRLGSILEELALRMLQSSFEFSETEVKFSSGVGRSKQIQVARRGDSLSAPFKYIPEHNILHMNSTNNARFFWTTKKEYVFIWNDDVIQFLRDTFCTRNVGTRGTPESFGNDNCMLQLDGFIEVVIRCICNVHR